MPGPARRYLGLTDDVNPFCLDKLSPWFRPAPIVVVEPYEGVSEVGIEVPGIIGAGETAAVLSLMMPMSDTLHERGPGTLGWESDTERQLLERMDEHLTEVRQEVYATGAENKRKYRDMIDDARAQFDFIVDTYHYFNWQKAYLAPGDGAIRAPLSRDWDDFQEGLNRDVYAYSQTEWRGSLPPTLLEERQAARQEIREAWDHMLSVMWCCEIWVASVESAKANRDIYYRNVANRDSALTMAPTTGQSQAQGRVVTNLSNTSPVRTTRSQEAGESKSSGMVLLAMTVGVAFLLSRGK